MHREGIEEFSGLQEGIQTRDWPAVMVQLPAILPSECSNLRHNTLISELIIQVISAQCSLHTVLQTFNIVLLAQNQTWPLYLKTVLALLFDNLLQIFLTFKLVIGRFFQRRSWGRD